MDPNISTPPQMNLSPVTPGAQLPQAATLPADGDAVKPVQTNPPAADESAQTTHGQDTPAMADDVDLIEKEWVNKAKKIIHDFADDPFEQARALTELKSEYIQKRYNKTVKLSQ